MVNKIHKIKIKLSIKRLKSIDKNSFQPNDSLNFKPGPSLCSPHDRGSIGGARSNEAVPSPSHRPSHTLQSRQFFRVLQAGGILVASLPAKVRSEVCRALEMT